MVSVFFPRLSEQNLAAIVRLDAHLLAVTEPQHDEFVMVPRASQQFSEKATQLFDRIVHITFAERLFIPSHLRDHLVSWPGASFFETKDILFRIIEHGRRQSLLLVCIFSQEVRNSQRGRFQILYDALNGDEISHFATAQLHRRRNPIHEHALTLRMILDEFLVTLVAYRRRMQTLLR